MTSHEDIKAALARAIAASETVRAYCVSNFGRGALVIVNWFGSEGTPGERESPFVFITSDNDENEAGMVDEQTFRVTVVVGGVDSSDEPTRVAETARTATANGLVINGIAKKLETLRGHVEDIVKAGGFGAVARTFGREESSVSDFPLEWAKLKIEFFEPQAI